MASAGEAVLLKSTLEIQGKSYSVKLTASEIYWEVVTSARASGGPYSEPLVSRDGCGGALYRDFLRQQPPLEKVYYLIGSGDNVPSALLLPPFLKYVTTCPKCACLCKTENQTVKLNEIVSVRLGGASACTQNANQGKFHSLEMQSLSPTCFSVTMVRRASKHKWRDRKVAFHSKDTSVIQQWVEKINEILSRPEFNRPKSLLVFINPVSGKKMGAKIYHDKVAPLFEKAGISTEVVTTQRQNHARDMLMEYDLSKIDGVVCVGGDGMFSELMHGLLTRTLRNQGIDHPSAENPPQQPELRIGVIPSGSTDTVVYSSQGINDPVTAALHIIIGDSVAMDVATVHHGNQFVKYNVSLLGYGYYGDCILDSERNRWLGPRRYDWSGLKKVISNKVYEGEISYLPSPDKENHPRDGTNCKAGCQVCQAVSPAENNHSSQPEASMKDDDTDEWKRVKGHFVGVNAFMMSCRCPFSYEGPSPAAHLGDGYLDLVLVHECSRLDYTKHLISCMKKNSDQFDFPFIQVMRVKEFKFRPLVDSEIEDSHDASDAKVDGQQRLRSRSTHNSVWNCDGEVLEEPAIDVRLYRQTIKLFARGVEDEIKESGNNCLNCGCLRTA